MSLSHADHYATPPERAPTASLTAEGYRACGSSARHRGFEGEETMQDFMAITKALADENRVRILLALRSGELCVCQIVELVQLATSTVSRHMSVLKHARLVESRKEGRWMYYRLPAVGATELAPRAIDWVARMLVGAPSVLRDTQRLREICSADPHSLCAARAGAKQQCNHSQPLSSEVKQCSN